MRRKILLPTDFSKNAWHAINYALELFKDDDCDFYLLNVFSIPNNIFEALLNMEPGSEFYEMAKSKSEKGLGNHLDMLMLDEHSNPRHQFKSIATFNNIIEGIKSIVDEKDIEMIVMGTKGETRSRKTIFGSTAIFVMEKVRNCPVIVVPEKSKCTMPKEIVFPTNYKTNFKRRELIYLTEIAKKCNANIAVLHISDNDYLDKQQKRNKEMLEEYLEDVSHSYHILSNYSVEPAVNLFIESRDSDMVAFINKKHRFFGSILTNAMVKGISFHSKVPILVMHDLIN
ncbi:universal stress protein [Yeosuana sp. MJ-SS3]|uniref:Universal stress protein n=1 Tax=Gilvirhabdus luticola TaxID=3079858 RepID=A0ABU3U5V4_9FLAO|nr:universal stress protein [Yeosuana sp. MJ-SS3]MDU8885702.1 universal stress protein [Yeosuana sp. MJ-SS3]